MAEDRRQPGGPSLRRPAWRLGLLLLVSYAYFLPKPAWNEVSRFDLVRALVERGRVDIDPDHPNTEDKALYGGHHYSDKAPGASLLALPAYAGYRAWLRLRDQDPPRWLPESALRPAGIAPPARGPGEREPVVFNQSFLRAIYVCNLFTNVPAGAACAVLLFLVLGRSGVSPGRALVATLALALGSPFFAYATMFYGHVLAGTFLFGAFSLIGPWFEAGDGFAGRAARWPPGRLAAAGALLGLAVLTELPAAVGALLLAGYAWRRLPPAQRPRGLGWLAAGALPPLVVLAAYQTAAFDRPWRTGYGYVTHPTFAAGMSAGLFGVTWPRPGALLGLLFGRARGLFYLAPVLLLGAVGLGRGVARRLPGSAAALAVLVSFALINASYYMWWGGAALGPRHLVPALPFLALGIPLGADGLRRWWAATSPLLLVSMANVLVVSAVSALVPFGIDVLFEHGYAHLRAGRLAILPGASNLGLLLGLRGWSSLLPLLVAWAIGLAAVVAALPRPRELAVPS